MKFFLRICSFVLLVLLAGSQVLVAQTKYDYQVLNVGSGLPHPSVLSIVQDDKGFMWFATRNGLVRYDGKTYLRFTVHGHKGSLSSNQVNVLLKDSKGFLWIGTDNGLDRMNMATYAVENMQGADRKNVKSYAIVSLFESRNGTIWIGTSNARLYKYTGRGNYSLAFKGRYSNMYGYPIAVFAEDTIKHGLWVRSATEELAVMDNSGRIMETHQVEPYNVCISRKTGTWLGHRYGIKKYDYASSAFEEVKLPGKLEKPYRMYSDHKNTIWISQAEVRLFSYDTDGLLQSYDALFSTFSYDSYRITTLFEDRLHNLWIGTTRGIVKFHLASRQFNQYMVGRGDSSNSVRSILETPSGDLYMGGYGFFQKYARSTGKWTSLRTKPTYMPYSMQSIGDSVLWIATEGNGLKRLDTKTQKVHHCNMEYRDRPSHMFLISHFMDHDGKFWLGTYDNIFRYDPVSEKLNEYNIVFDSIMLGNIKGMQFYETRDKHLWIASNMGLFELDEKRNPVRHFSERDREGFSLSNNYVSNVLEGKVGYLWICTANGLNRLDRKTGHISVYTTANGLADNIVVSVLEDNQSRLWIATNNGLSMFDKRTEQFRNFYTEDGLSDNEFNHGAFFKGNDGTFYFGGMNGVNSFRPEQIVPRQQDDIPLLITAVELGKSDTANRAQDMVDLPRDVYLPYTSRNMRIQFALTDYTHPERNVYAYMFEGIDKDWIQLGNQAFINFTSLAPGDYKLLIKAAGSTGIWTRTPEVIHILVDEVYYKKWWFVMLVAIVVGTLGYAAFRFRINRIHELANMRIKIASDLHDEVGSVLTSVAMKAELMALETSDEHPRLLHSIVNSCRTAMSNMRDVVWSIDARNDRLANLIDRMSGHITQMTEDTRFTYSFDYDDSISDEKINPNDRQNIYLIFKEAVNNIIKHSAGDRMKVQFYKKEGILHLIIEDNGVVENYDTTHGSGLKNMHMRAKNIKAVLKMEADRNGFRIHLKKELN